ncbi:MAG: response regulator [Acidobacteriota bacterium]|jgi:CheY-like chemotaxis protein|nr:response regulator [Acidobacteriota bacterium]
MSGTSAGGTGYQYSLVVGNDGPDRAWVEAILMRGGLEVAACTEAELLAMPDIVPPQIIILDDATAREERMATFANLRAHPPLVGVPIVVLAYDADIDSFSAAVTRGAAAYLVKPVPAEEVVAVAHKISGWLSSSDRTEKRRRLRRPLLLRVDVEVRARKLIVPGQIVDVSGTGCRVELKEPLEKGESVRVTLYGLEGSTNLTLGGEVRWHRQAPDGTHVIGAKFTGTAAVLAGRMLGTIPDRL